MFGRRRHVEDVKKTAHENLHAVADGVMSESDYIAYLDRTIAQHPKEAQFRVLRGVALMTVDGDAAWDELKNAAVLAPDDPGIVFRVASAWRTLGDSVHAEEAARHVDQIKPDHFVLEADLVALFGLLAWDNGLDAVAETELRRALTLEPTNATSAAALVQFLARNGRQDEARRVVDSGARSLQTSELLAREIGRISD